MGPTGVWHLLWQVPVPACAHMAQGRSLWGQVLYPAVPPTPLQVESCGVDDVLRLGGRTVLLTKAILEGEFLTGSIFLRQASLPLP